MRRCLITVLACGALTLSQAQAGSPAPLTAEALGTFEGIEQFCGPIDPAATAKLRETIKQLVQNADEAQLAALRDSDGYRSAYDSVQQAAGKGNPQDAKRFCSTSPTNGK